MIGWGELGVIVFVVGAIWFVQWLQRSTDAGGHEDR